VKAGTEEKRLSLAYRINKLFGMKSSAAEARAVLIEAENTHTHSLTHRCEESRANS
jgi:hypothetical protein